MRAYPVELRKRVVEAVEKLGMSRRKAAEVFGVGEATVYRYLKRNREGGLSAKSPPGRPCKLDEAGWRRLLEQLKAKPDLTLQEHAELYAKDNGVVLAPSTPPQ